MSRKKRKNTTKINPNSNSFSERFKPYSRYLTNTNSNNNSHELTNKLVDLPQPQLITDPTTGQEKWVLESDNNLSFSGNSKHYEDDIPSVSKLSLTLSWLKSKWYYFLFLTLFTLPLIFSTTLLTKLVNSQFTNWFFLMLRTGLEKQIYGASIFHWIFHVLLGCWLITFIFRVITKLPHVYREQIANNRLSAKLNLLNREQQERQALIQDYHSRLDDIEAKQDLIHRARYILTNQVTEDKANRLVLNERLGTNNIPVKDSPLGSLILQCLGDTYFNKSNVPQTISDSTDNNPKTN